MITSSERVVAQLHLKETDRVPITDNPWHTTVARWKKEGFPDDADVSEYFGFEFRGFGIDGSFMLPEKVVEETDEYVITTNKNGATLKNWKNKTSTPELVGFTLTTPKIWNELKPRLEFKPERIYWNSDKECYNKCRQMGLFVHVALVIGYDELSTTVGPETLLPAMLTEPEWVYDMFKTFIDLKIACVEEMLAAGYQFDGAFIYDDLGYRNGPFFSKQIYKELLMPHHKRLCDFLHSKGWKIILHSCGNVKELIPQLIEAGIDCLQPLEVKAGMDLIELKKAYGDKLAFMGGIDVRKMAAEDPRVIEEEIASKVSFAKKGGGYIFHSDHSIPDNVSLTQYKRVVDLCLKYGKY